LVAEAAVSAVGTLLPSAEAALTTALTAVPAAGAAMPAITARAAMPAVTARAAMPAVTARAVPAARAAVPAARAAVPAAVEAAAIFTGELLCSPSEAGAEVTLLASTLDVTAGMAAGDRKALLVAWLADAAWTTLPHIMAPPLTVTVL